MHCPRRPPRKPHRQLDLGLASPPMTPDALPAWRALPEGAQRVLTGLLTHLLIAHVGGAAPELALRRRGDAHER